MIDGKRFGVAPELIFEDPECLTGPHAPAGWLERVLVDRYVPYQWRDPEPSDQRGHRSHPSGSSEDDRWTPGEKGFRA